MEETVMWNILGRPMTPYAVAVWVACLVALGVFLWQGRKLKTSARLATVVLSAVLGLLGARLFYVAARWELFLDIGLQNFFYIEDEELRIWGAATGAAFWGAVGGVALGALLAGKLTRVKAADLLDALAPAGALGIAISRFGEFSIGEGIGPEVDVEALQFFPLSVVNEWEEWNYALFMLEGLVGLIIFVLLITYGRRLAQGYRARMFLVLYSSSQIILEALRRDNFLRWLFVRVSQVTAAVVLLGLVVFGILRWMKRPEGQRMSQKKLIGNGVIFLLMVPIIVILEFAVDKSPTLSVGMAYLLETICCIGMGVTSWNLAMKN
ncbi:MAG: prolipoprotein diacylglyceryl transferase [Clostridia bacterium]|nr:prolipoprotein diacylglyceryl transferase [Clostridia bacterium]